MGEAMADTDIMTIEQAAEYLQLNKQTVARMARRGDLPAVKVGGTWRISKSLLMARFEAKEDAERKEVQR
jgi:excisionase family DNA binding protein